MPRKDKKHEIMAAAEKLFHQRRFHEITLDDVAQAACVGKGTIYNYFKDKEDLFYQTTMSGLDDLIQMLSCRVSGNVAFSEQLVAMCEQIGKFHRQRRQLIHMAQDHEHKLGRHKGEAHNRWREQRHKLIAAVAQVLDRGVAEGGLRTDVSTQHLARYLLGMLRTRAREHHHTQNALPLETVVDLFLRGGGSTTQENAPDEAAQGTSRENQ